MDVLTSLLDGTRAREAFVLRCRLSAPFAMRIEDEAPIALIAAVRGHLHLVPDTGPAMVLQTGGVALIRGPEPCLIADSPTTQPSVVVRPGQRAPPPTGPISAA